MGGKGGGGGNATSMMQMQMQMKEAEEAKAKEAERKARIEQGMKSINELFEGKAVMGSRKKGIDFSGLGVGQDVKGFKVREKMGTSGGGGAAKGTEPTAAELKYMPWYNSPNYQAAQAAFGSQPNTGQYFDDSSNTWTTEQQRAAPAGNNIVQTVEGYELLDANGNVVASGKSLDDLKKYQAQEDETYDTGQKEGGIGEGLYSKYRQSQKDYYFPALAKQYQKAKEDLTYKHADAGTLVSSMAGENVADVEGQNLENTSQINSQIEDSVGALKRQVASDKQSLINQLYATEDPTMAANAATARVGSINTQQPSLSPIGEFFKLAAIGGGSALQAANNPYGSVQPYRGINTSAAQNYPRT